MTDLVSQLVGALDAFVERFKDHEDTGPRGEMWQSDEFLAELAQARAALSEAKAVPMTDEQVKAARRSVCDDPDELPEPWAFRMGIRAAEAHHGTTAQGAQEGV